MEKLEMVQKVMECTGSNFEDAKNALDATDFDVLEAIVMLEKDGKSKTAAQAQPTEEMPRAEETVEEPEVSRAAQVGHRFSETWERLMDSVRRVCRYGLDTSFVIEREGKQVFTMPVLLFVILFVAAFWVCVPLLIVGLFFDLKYRFKGVDSIQFDVNAIADKAADIADTIKREASNVRDKGQASC